MTKTNPAADAPPPKPRVAFAIATSFGLGYLPKAPGTWGSLFGVMLGWAALSLSLGGGGLRATQSSWQLFAEIAAAIIVVVSVVGVWAAGRVAHFLGREDPQIVVVDEVAGQLIAYLGLATHRSFALNWKYLLLGFILFRVFDIWKPFPARQAEDLPGGLGIMADDWIAGVYAALLLLLVRRLGF